MYLMHYCVIIFTLKFYCDVTKKITGNCLATGEAKPHSRVQISFPTSSDTTPQYGVGNRPRSGNT